MSPRALSAREQRSPLEMDEELSLAADGTMVAGGEVAFDDQIGDEGRLLRVVGLHRRRRGWQVGTVAGVLLFAALFVIAGAQALIVQQQQQIDVVNDRVDAAEGDAEQLKLELAELQSPQRITDVAATQLGMVPAPPPVYLLPRPDDDDRAAEIPPATPTTTTPPATTPTTVRPALKPTATSTSSGSTSSGSTASNGATSTAAKAPTAPTASPTTVAGTKR